MHTFSQHMQSFPSELGTYILFCCLRESNAVELVHNSDCIWSNQSTEYRTPRIILYAAVIIMRSCIRFIDVRLKVRNPTVWDLLPRFGWTAVNDLSLPRGELHQSPPRRINSPSVLLKDTPGPVWTPPCVCYSYTTAGCMPLAHRWTCSRGP